MSNLRDRDDRRCDGESRDVLRRKFLLLTETSRVPDGTDNLSGSAAAVMADLLTVAEMLQDDESFHDRAREIVDFCREQALPRLTASVSRDSVETLLLDVESRWSEYLALLSPEERCSRRPTAATSADEEHGWNETLRAELTIGGEDSESGQRDDFRDSLDSLCQSHPLNVAGIMAALAANTDFSDETRAVSAMSETVTAVSAAVPLAGRMTAKAMAPLGFGNQGRPDCPPDVESIDDPEMIAAYADDAQLCVSEMETSLLGLESGQDAVEALRSFCRQLHTLKGASGTVGLSRLAKYLHDLESDIEKTDAHRVDVDRLLACVDTVRAQLHSLGIAGSVEAIASVSFPTVVSQSSESRVSPGSSGTAFPAAAEPDCDGNNSQAPASARVPEPTVARPQQSASPASDSELFVRVEASRLERLMDLLAELVMLRNRRDTYTGTLRNIHRELNYCATRTRALTSSAEFAPAGTGEGVSDAESQKSSAKSRLLSRTLDEVSKDTGELARSLQEVFNPLSDDNAAVSHLIGQFRQELMDLRRLPVSGLFQRLQRVIRDAARSEGKRVEVVFEGQGARAERAVQERLFEPLLHLVRNAVSHGLDTPEGRARQGKSETGRITLAASSDASSLLIEVRDDGKGLNDEAIEIRGRELGLLSAGETMTRAQLWKLIFHPGFSTKASVSEVSGRGIGMDVVDSQVKRLRGRIDVESVRGEGTTIRLQIPLRSAVEHAMVVRSGGQLFALPMHTVSGTSDSVHPDRRRAFSGAVRPVVPLSRVLGGRGSSSNPCCCISLKNHSGSSRTAGQRDEGVTIAVDAIVGVEEVVVRTLPAMLQRNELFAGVTLSGRAETVLLLDVRKVVELFERGLSADERRAPDTASEEIPPRNPKRDRCVLVVDDSVVIRRSLSRKLRAAGYEVREASSGRDAMAVLQSGGITSVITDLDMPGMTGVELLQEIQRQRQLKKIPVTVLTSRDDELMLTKVRQHQPAAVLHKPVTEATVKAILDSLNGSEVAVS